ncbi:MAG TPA: helix-turn-helix transcriptional regulator [Plasticicumulans sp.]|nr:helix-turn-helix transcriptional regulator [Plasticicumulans sp.]
MSKGYLSQVEAGRRTGTVDTLRALAQALGVTLADLDGSD